ncbi:HAD-like domain-containing protein [Trichophaea hybrida]|nr:HAD-like domain-containing protein [Trichophaea hybrida]
MSPPSRLRFAPLSPTANSSPAPSLAGIVFDVDGTLTLPQSWMFVKMRQALGISSGVDILSHVASLPSPDAAMELVKAVEREAMLSMQPSRGLVELMESFYPPKPSPNGILHIAKQWGLEDGSRLIMVGDSMDDMAAGRKAGAATVLLVNEGNRELGEHEFTDCVVERLDELVDVLEGGLREVARSIEEVKEEMGRVEQAVMDR